MARRRPQPVRRPARSITAAATRLDPTDADRARKETKKRPLDWQVQAFRFYDDVGEVRFGANWMANALSRLRLVPAWEQEPGMQPVPVGSEEEAVDAEAPEEERLAAQSVLSRLGSSEGGESEILRSLGLNLFVTGEGYLIGRADPDIPDMETWGVYSVSAVTVDTSGQYAIKPSPNAKRDEYIVIDDDDALVLRIGRRHPEYPDMPDSAMRGALDYCTDLRILTAMIRAAASSRVPSKILGIPQEADFGAADTTEEEGDGAETGDPLTRDLIAHMTTPLSDPKSAAAMVPFILRLAGEDLDKTKVIDLTREIDTLAIQLRDETRRAFAASVDLPAEIITGRSDLNHWTMASVTQEAYTIHVEPYGQGIADALTFGYFRPSLVDLVEDPRKWSIAVDPAGLVTSPDQSKDVQDAYDRGEVSGAYYRDVRGIPEDAAPDDEELERRARLAKIIGSARGPQQGAPPEGAPAPATGPDEDTQEIPDAVLVPPRALTAASTPLDTLGPRLARAEMLLRERLRAAADEALVRALERAGNRLRSLAQRDRLARQVVVDVPVLEVASSLGPGLVASLGSGVDDLLEGAWARVETKWNVLVEATQRQAFAYVLDAAPEADATWDEWADRFAERRAEGLAVLLGGLQALARERLYNPIVEVPEKGEWSASTLVSPRLVRRALQVAGESPSLTAVGMKVEVPLGAFVTEESGGMLSGRFMGDVLKKVAKAKPAGAYVWMWGGAERPFPAHQELDGVEFSGWDDEALTVWEDDAWLGVSHYRPDDHDGCTCEAVRMIRGGSDDDDPMAIVDQAAQRKASEGLKAGRGKVEQVASGRSREGWEAWGKQRGLADTGSLHETLTFSGASEAEKTAIQSTLDRLLVEHADTLGGPNGLRSITGIRKGPGSPYGRIPGADRAYGTTGGTHGSDIVLTGDESLWAKKAYDATIGHSFGPANATSTIVHELGHAVHRGLVAHGIEREAFAKASAAAARAAEKAVELRAKIELGTYSTENGFEMFAEMFKSKNLPGANDMLRPGGRALVDEYARLMNEWVARETGGAVTKII